MPSASYRDDTTRAARQPGITPRRPARGAPRGRPASSSSTTLYQAESRFWPSRTSMCLRWMPSNVAGSARERGAGALVERVRLELDAAAAEDVERVLQLEELGLRVRARAPRCRRQPRPADLEAPRAPGAAPGTGSTRPRVPLRRAPWRTPGRARRRRDASASSIQACHSSRVCGWTIGSHRQTRGSRDASQRSSACSLRRAARAARSGPRASV